MSLNRNYAYNDIVLIIKYVLLNDGDRIHRIEKRAARQTLETFDVNSEWILQACLALIESVSPSMLIKPQLIDVCDHIAWRGVTWRFTFTLNPVWCTRVPVVRFCHGYSYILLEPSACMVPIMRSLSPPRCSVGHTAGLPHSGDYYYAYRGSLNVPRSRLPFVSDLSQILGTGNTRARTRHSQLHHEPFQSAHGFVQWRRSGIPTSSPRLIAWAPSAFL